MTDIADTTPEDDGPYLWTAALPNGKIAILRRDNALKGWHQELGIFPDLAAAHAHARKNALTLHVGAKTKMPREKGPITWVAEMAEKIMGHIDAMYAAHPGGISAQVVMATIDDDRYHSVLAALRFLGETKQAQWRKLGTTARFLFPNGVELPTLPILNAPQDKVLQALINAADAEGIVTMGYRDIGRAAGLAPNTLSYSLQALRTKGYVELLQSGASKLSGKYNQPSTYRVSRVSGTFTPPATITIDSFSKEALAGKSEAENEALERKFWEQMGVNPDTDLYPPEERAQRFKQALQGAMRKRDQ